MADTQISTLDEIDPTKKRVVFLHPDLGIGGAERLVIDAAVGLQERGCKVTIFTSHCDQNHCFDEAKDGTLDVRVRGDTLFPTTIFGHFAILCAVARQLHLIWTITVSTKELKSLQPTHFFIDQLSAGVPLLRLLSATSTRILFYCHFPDKLLAKPADGILGAIKSIYRVPFDALEAWSTARSDEIVVNSKFTAETVHKTMPGLADRQLKVIYPCVDTEALAKHKKHARNIAGVETVFLSINRFERKKDIDLAIHAYAKLDEQQRDGSVLIIAGGYDPRVQENVLYLRDLEQLATNKGLKHKTVTKVLSLSDLKDTADLIFLPSVSDKIKQSLLDSAKLLIYTPNNEHFGIVPLEAMLNEIPVLAAAQGGPLETIVDGETGWLRPVDAVEEWTAVLHSVIKLQHEDPHKLAQMGQHGKVRVQEMFTKSNMASLMSLVMDRMSRQERASWLGESAQIALTLFIALVLCFVGVYIFAFVQSRK